MSKIKLIASASLLGVVMMSSVALAAEMTAAPTTNPVASSHATTMTTEQKACVKTAKATKLASFKSAKAAYKAAMKDAASLSKATEIAKAKSDAHKVYVTAKIDAAKMYRADRTSCLK